ncbi:MAG: hypothetical protein A2167_06515 [Planctomycetes bacterium RBG_13_46_10]|nr:MAG: hypothetical protein A2167_06515 [Planctomycetes bacterium RBG_13_46_10]
MDLPKTIHGCTHNKEAYLFYPLKSCYFLFSSFKKHLLFLMNSLSVRASGCFLTIGISPILLLGRILPSYVVEGSKGASHGGELLSAPAEFLQCHKLTADWTGENSIITIGKSIMV